MMRIENCVARTIRMILAPGPVRNRSYSWIRVHVLVHAVAITTLCFVSRIDMACAEDFRNFIETHCAECHDGADAEGGIDLMRFTDETAVMNARGVWRLIYEKLESRQMPPPKRESQPDDAQRAAMLGWIEAIAARPDPVLGERDPGKPVLRRLTRLEYNNAVRDLFELDVDVFMFPERLPIADKSYFQPSRGKLDGPLKVSLREYGGKYPVLCPQLGLPGDNRAEHGYRNRGDAMNFSPLLFERYLAAARDIVNSPDLPVRSEVAAELFGIDAKSRQALAAARKEKQTLQRGDGAFAAVDVFAPKKKSLRSTDNSEGGDLLRFREAVQQGFANSISGVFDAGDRFSGASVVPGKGGLLRIPFAGNTKNLTINPDADLWVVGFATAEATSGAKLFCNHEKRAKQFELTFKLEGGDEDEGLIQLAVCVLGRKNESGKVALTARLTDGTESTVTAEIEAGPEGTRFVSFTSVPGESIKSLLVDGSQFSGDYVLLDDLGFITNGSPRPVKEPADPAKAVGATPAEKPAINGVQESESPSAKTAVDVPVRSARERLRTFVARSFRRNVSEDDVQPFLDLFDAAVTEGRTEIEAVRAALVAVLASPQFLFVDANGVSDDKPVVPLKDTELATRLALFLWASIPDRELLRIAETGRLHEPAVLEAQTRRMLRDPKSRELSEAFATQWLRLDQLYAAKPDRDLFKSFYSGPQGKSTLHGAMLTEALLLFETVHVEDRSILDFIVADYTWLNPGLAKLYDVPLEDKLDPSIDVADTTRELKTKDEGPAWRRVKLQDTQRGGFVTMSAPLVVTSLPFRTSPVKRGAWLLETIFNRPPTEPKVAFAIENDSKEAAQQMSVRQKFEAHRTQAACYSCHVRLDPPGFALERFSPIGQWRENDGGQAIDAKGEWQGRTFDGPAEFKAILAERPHEFTRGFIEHLLSYALGRDLEIYDMPTVVEIQRIAQADDWKFSRIIVEIVKSYPFTHTRRPLP